MEARWSNTHHWMCVLHGDVVIKRATVKKTHVMHVTPNVEMAELV